MNTAVVVVIYHSTHGEMGDETLVRYLENLGGMLPTFSWGGEDDVEAFVSGELRKTGLFAAKAEDFRSHGEWSLLGDSVHLVSVYAPREDVFVDIRRPGAYATLHELLNGKLNNLHRVILKMFVEDCKPARAV